MAQFSPDLFKQTLGQLAGGVTVVTTVYEGTPIGITATSFASLSLDPPLVTISLAKKLFTHKVVSEAEMFAVNILGAEQLEWGQLFAGMFPDRPDRFAGIDHFSAETGCPLLPGVPAWVDCRLWATYDGGDHTIFVGEVVALDATDGNEPLLYHNRRWLQGAPFAD